MNASYLAAATSKPTRRAYGRARTIRVSGRRPYEKIRSLDRRHPITRPIASMSPSRSRISVRDELARLEGHVRTRMAELAPLVDEYRELEQIANRLGLDIANGAGNGAGPRLPDGRRGT